MATTNGGYATGAGRDEAELRRRNITSYDNANGQHIYKVEAEDKKKLQKVSLFQPLHQPRSNEISSPNLVSWPFLTNGNS
jgi:hypothetical protein